MARPKPPKPKPASVPVPVPEPVPKTTSTPLWKENVMREALILHIGATKSGKSMLLSRHAQESRYTLGLKMKIPTYRPTLRSSSYRDHTVPSTGEKCRVELCDCGGDPAPEKAKYWEEKAADADALILTYSITNRESYEAVPELWKRFVQLKTEANADFNANRFPLCLVATHADADADPELTVKVSEDEGGILACDLRPDMTIIPPPFYCSAVNGAGVADVYEYALNSISAFRHSTPCLLTEYAQKTILRHIHNFSFYLDETCAPVLRNQLWNVLRSEKILNDTTLPLFLPGDCLNEKPVKWLPKYWIPSHNGLTIELDNLNEISDDALKAMSKSAYAERIERLSLKGCRKITLEGISAFLGAAKTLSSLVLPSTLDLCGGELDAHISFSNSLKHLEIGKIDELVIDSTNSGEPPALAVLEVGKCTGFDYMSIAKCTNIERLVLHDCSTLTPDILYELMKHIPELYHISISDVKKGVFNDKEFKRIFESAIELHNRKLMSITLMNWFDLGDNVVDKFRDMWKAMRKEEGMEEEPDFFMMNVTIG